MKYSVACLSVFLFLYTALSQAETKVYHWVDKQGKSHFSDTAPAGTEELIIENQNLVSPPPISQNQHLTNNDVNKKNNNTKKQTAINYQAEIIKPQEDMAVRSNDGTLDISVKITPEKNTDQYLQLLLDGLPIGSPQISSTIRALNVDRGTHQIQVYLQDEAGKVLTKTQIVTVHLQRAIIK